nr:MAG TPA: hypothetical protein [Caudoviricetes sp.]
MLIFCSSPHCWVGDTRMSARLVLSNTHLRH